MKTILFLLLLPLFSQAQLGKYGVTVIPTVSPAWSCIANTTYTICVTIDNFNQCSGNWIDAVEIQYSGDWQNDFSYISKPSASWKTSMQSNDEPAGWKGWSFNEVNPPSRTWDDLGENTTGPLTYCFSISSALASDPCWLATCTNQITTYIWGDGDTGGSAANCPTKGTPDGPYSLLNEDCTNPLPVKLLYFRCEKSELLWGSAYEYNIDYYLIEGSNDITNWTQLDRIPAEGAYMLANYRIPTHDDFEYYSLSEVNYNEEAKLLKIIDCNGVDVDLEAFWNIYTITGQLVRRNALESSLIAPGIYILENSKTGNLKMIKK